MKVWPPKCWRCDVGEPIEFHVCEAPKDPTLETHFQISQPPDGEIKF